MQRAYMAESSKASTSSTLIFSVRFITSLESISSVGEHSSKT